MNRFRFLSFGACLTALLASSLALGNDRCRTALSGAQRVLAYVSQGMEFPEAQRRVEYEDTVQSLMKTGMLTELAEQTAHQRVYGGLRSYLTPVADGAPIEDSGAITARPARREEADQTARPPRPVEGATSAEDPASTARPPRRISTSPSLHSSLPPPVRGRPWSLQDVRSAGDLVLTSYAPAVRQQWGANVYYVAPSGWAFIEDRNGPPVSAREIRRRIGSLSESSQTELRRAVASSRADGLRGHFVYYPRVRYRPLAPGETALSRAEAVLGTHRLEEILDANGRPPGGMFHVFRDLDHPDRVIKVIDPELGRGGPGNAPHSNESMSEHLQRVLAFQPVHRAIGLNPFNILNPSRTRMVNGLPITTYDYVDDGVLVVERIDDNGLDALEVLRNWRRPRTAPPVVIRDSRRPSAPPPGVVPEVETVSVFPPPPANSALTIPPPAMRPAPIEDTDPEAASPPVVNRLNGGDLGSPRVPTSMVPPSNHPPQRRSSVAPPTIQDEDFLRLLDYWELGDAYDGLFRQLDRRRTGMINRRYYGLRYEEDLSEHNQDRGIDRGYGNVPLQPIQDPITHQILRYEIRLRDF